MKQKNEITKTFIVIKSLEKFTMSFITSSYVLFILSHGYELKDANLVNAFFMTVAFLFDPISGKLADKIGQKTVYLSSFLFWGLGTLVYFRSTTFCWFLVAEGTAGIGMALRSEALESWVRNQIGADETHKLLSRSSWITNIVSLPSAVIGAYIGSQYGHQYPWLIEGSLSFVTFLMSLLLLRKFKEYKHPEELKIEDIGVKKAIAETIHKAELRWTAIVVLLLSFCYAPFNMFWSKIFSDTSGSEGWLGLLWVGVTLSIILGANIANRLGISSKRTIVLSIVGIGMGILVASTWTLLPIMVAGFLVHEVLREVAKLQIWSYSNLYTENHNRSTMNSVRSSLWFLGNLGGLLAFALISSNPLFCWLIAALILIGAGGFELQRLRKE